MKINFAAKTVKFGDVTLKEGDWLSLNGSKGYVYGEKIDTKDASENPLFIKFMSIVDKYRRLGIRTNADTPEDASVRFPSVLRASDSSVSSICSMAAIPRLRWPSSAR
jgi:pyruvate,orthophosphate dikinase